jgi:phenylacetic acid degradation protein
MPKVYAIDGITPVVHPSAFVHPSAVLIGDVIVRARAYIGPCASLRGDFGRIVVEEGANIQDTARVLRTLTAQELRWKKDNMHA